MFEKDYLGEVGVELFDVISKEWKDAKRLEKEHLSKFISLTDIFKIV